MKTANIRTDEFNRLIDATKDFTAQKDQIGARPIYNYIKMEFNAETSRVTAMAVDGHRMSVEHAVISECEENFTAYINSKVKLPKGKWATIYIDVDGTDKPDVMIRCDDFVFSYEQPKDGDFIDWRKVIPSDEPVYRIGFNGEYMLAALKAAKVSCGGFIKNPIVLEFRSPSSPILLRTNDDDIKMVMPFRLND